MDLEPIDKLKHDLPVQEAVDEAIYGSRTAGR